MICIFILAMTGCLLGRLMVFFKTNALFFDWGKDVFYSLKVGVSAGALAGLGIWIKIKLQQKKKMVNKPTTISVSRLELL